MIGLINLVMNLLHIYSFIIIAAALITWVQPNPYNPIVQFLRRVTEPVLKPVRGLVPPEKLGGLDISPLIVLVVIEYVIPRVLLALLF
jgi:YggT family protein